MSGQGPPSIYEFGGFELDVTQRLLHSKGGRLVPLTPRVFEALSYLVGHAGQLIEKSALLEAIWPRAVVEEGSLSQAIYELRRALGERPDEHRFIVTVPGRGYQFVAEVTHRERPSTAYEHFLLAQFFFTRRQLGDLRRAEQEYRRALALDPAFARAWVGLSGVYYVSLDRYADFGMSRPQALERMRDAVDRALELDPRLAEAHVRRAMYRLEAGDREGGREHARRAAALEPNNPVVLWWLSEIALSEGRPDDAVEFQRGAVRHDPLAPVPRANLGTILYFAGRFDEAETELRRALQIAGAPDAAWGNPNDPFSAAGIGLAKVLIAQRRYDEAFTLIQSWPPGQLRDSCLAQVHHARGEDSEADAALKRLVASATAEPHWIAETYAHRVEVDRAFRWLAIAAERSRERRDGRQTWRLDIRYSPFVTSMHGDPRWKAWLGETDWM